MKRFFYIAANSQEDNGGIHIYSLTDDAPEFPVLETVVPLKGTGYFTFSPDGKIFYAVWKDGSVNKVASFLVKEGGSKLEFVSALPTDGLSSCHLTASPDGEWLYTANYSSGTITEFKLTDGHFRAKGRVIALTGALGPNKARQEHTHAHNVVFTPDGKNLACVDLGADAVNLYPYSKENGIPDTPKSVYLETPGEGPRHILFHPDGIHAYLANELGNTVSVLAYRNGALEKLQNLPTIPDSFHDFTKVAAVRLSPDAKRLVASNRGHDSIACYNVGSDALLTSYAIVKIGGVSPRDVNFLPFGKLFVSCNETSSDLTFFKFDSRSGAFEPLNRKDSAPGAMCAVHE